MNFFRSKTERRDTQSYQQLIVIYTLEPLILVFLFKLKQKL